MVSRRQFIASAGSAFVLLPSLVRARVTSNPFTLGIASGSPRERSVILWTRLAPEPLRGGGMPAGDVELRYQVCSDDAMRNTVREGTALAREQYAHSVHLRIDGLKPGREYWYRFMLGDYETVVGRTRTTSRDSRVTRLAVASCQHWQSGYWAAYADITEWAPDCVVYVGDYIYEGGPGTLGRYTQEVDGETFQLQTVRLHNSNEVVTLWDYRNRYALYRSDPQLQAAHAASPWIMAMDDHEIDNNWAGDIPQDPWAQTPLEFQVRKLAALKAYYEHMPMEQPPAIRGIESGLLMHGLYRFGPVQVHLLDTRQFRSDQPCEDRRQPLSCAERIEPGRTMLGAEQEAWLLSALRASDARFNVLASQVWFSSLVYNADTDTPVVNVDSWDGYPLARQRILDTLAQGVSNPVVISGDWHCAAATTLHADPMDAQTRRIGHEFAGTSISSDCSWAGQVERAKTHNPHFRYVNGRQRGYIRFLIEANQWTTQFRVVYNQWDDGSNVVTDQEMRLTDL